jgi:hypothetical protein
MDVKKQMDDPKFWKTFNNIVEVYDGKTLKIFTINMDSKLILI